MNFTDTGSRIKTTVVGTPYYRLYKKTFLKGEDILLDGNLYGGGNSDTNYFLILKRAGDTSEGYPSNLCEAKPDIYPAISISNPRGIPGKDKALIQWQNPTDENLSSIVIRQGKNSPPISMGDGDPPVGSPLNDHTFEVNSLVPNKTYYFSLFSLDKNGKWIRSTVSFTTGKDTDGDGLSDDWEAAQLTPWGLPLLNSGNPDTDGDGEDDRTEIINGTNPQQFNFFKPYISGFRSTPTGNTQYPIITLNAGAMDEKGITGWMVTKTSTPPLGSDSRWVSVGTPVQGYSNSPAMTVTLTNLGTHTFYVWAKNAAGQVNDAYGLLTINYDGQKIPRFLYETNDRANTLGAYSIDLETGKLTNIQTIPYDSSNMPFGRGPLGIVVHPTSKYVYVTDGGSLFSYSADKTTGMLSPIDTKSFGNRINDPTDQLYMHPSGKSLYAFNSGSTMFRVYSIQPDGTAVYSTELVLGSYIYNRPDIGYYKSVFATNFKERQEVYSGMGALAQYTGVYAPVDSYKNSIEFEPTGTSMTAGFLRDIGSTYTDTCMAMGGFCPYVAYPNPLSGYVIHKYAIGTVSFDSMNGSLQGYTLSPGPMAAGWDQANEGSLFTNSLAKFPLRSKGYFSQLASTLLSVSVVNFNGGDPRGTESNKIYQCNYIGGEPIINQGGGSRSANYCNPYKYYDLGFDITKIVMDPTNHFLYVPYREQSSGASKMINAYSINQQNGDLTPIDTDVTGTSSIFDVKVLDIHDYNDPPVVNIQKPAQQYINLDTGGRIFLNGSYSYDPDYGKCGGNPANFVYKWELTYAPQGSQKTSADIVNSNTLSSAYFDADVTGQYNFTLSFTDDHGTCPGMNKTTIGYLSNINVRKIKKTAEMVYTENPILPGGGDKIQWVPTKRIGGEVVDAGYIYRYGIMPYTKGSGEAADQGAISTIALLTLPEKWTDEQKLQYAAVGLFASKFSMIPVITCNTETYWGDARDTSSKIPLPYVKANSMCNKYAVAYVFEQWNPVDRIQTPVTEYGYWTYWSL